MFHYGDVTKIKGNEVPIVDIITFGAMMKTQDQVYSTKP